MLIEPFGEKRNNQVMKTVIVLGSSGLIGHQVDIYLRSKGNLDVKSFVYKNKFYNDSIIQNARDEISLINRIKDISPDFIVNCLGVLIGASNKDPENAIFLNAYLPHRLARLADEIGSKFIHISTDCVFSGKNKEPYKENDKKDGTNIYAKTKGLGEVITGRHLTLRTSVVGPELTNGGEELFNWFMCQYNHINGYTKSIWSGVTTLQLARAVECSIRKDIKGLHHVTNNESISKYELLKLFNLYAKKDINILPIEGVVSDKSFKDERSEFDFKIPSYKEMIDELFSYVKENHSKYRHYNIN